MFKFILSILGLGSCLCASAHAIEYHPKLPSTVRWAFSSTVSHSHKFKFESDPKKLVNNWYSQAFGGPSATHAMNYMEERVKFILPYRDDYHKFVTHLAVWDDRGHFAANFGMSIWMAKMQDRRDALYFTAWPGRKIRVDSPHVGIITLGSKFPTWKQELDKISPALLTSVLIHEARHSDCTGRITQGVLDGREPWPKDCGHQHEACPPGHPYEGVMACDHHAWGAFAVQWVWLNQVSLYCKFGCSTLDRSQALANAVDAKLRVLRSNELFAGKLGSPNMSNSVEVR